MPTLVGPASAIGTVFEFPDGASASVDGNAQITVSQNHVAQVLALGFQYAAQTISVVDGIIAHAGGGQASATQLVAAGMHRIVTCATLHDSVKLPTSTRGLIITVTNAGAAGCDVYAAAASEAMNGSTTVPVTILTGKTVQFICSVSGQWHSIQSA